MTSLPTVENPFLSQFPPLCKKILKENNITTHKQFLDFAQTHFLDQLTFASGKVIGNLTLKTLKEFLPANSNPVEQFYAHFSTKAVTVLKREKITSVSELALALSRPKQMSNARGVGKKLLADFEAFLALQ
jgi:hypothetical protein